MKYLIFVLFLVTICLSRAQSLKIVDDEAQDCEPFGARTLMGDYFLLEDKKQPVMTIAVNTADECQGLYLEYYKFGSDNKNVVAIENSYVKTIDGNKYLQDESTYLIYSHFFHIKNLAEGERYFYKINNQEDSEYHHFMVPYTNSDSGKQVNILVYGDFDANVRERTQLTEQEGNWGQYTHDFLSEIVENQKNADKLDENDFQMQLFLGDLAYEINDDDYQKGDKFFRKSESYNTGLPQIIALGNHESGASREQYGYKFVNEYFEFPDYKNYKNFNFNVDVAYAQIVNYDGQPMQYSEMENVQDRLDKLEQQLKAANERRSDDRPFIIVSSHYPIYFCDKGGCEQTYEQFSKVEKLLLKYNVDLYLSAHVHDYQRYYPLQDRDLCDFDEPVRDHFTNAKCPIYIVEGQAGNSYFHPKKIQDTRDDNHIQLEHLTGIPGAAKLSIFNNTHMRFQHYNTEQQQVVDEFWIIKDNSGMKTWVLVCIIVGSIIVAGLLGFLGFLVYKNKTSKDRLLSDASAEKFEIQPTSSKEYVDIRENNNNQSTQQE